MAMATAEEENCTDPQVRSVYLITYSRADEQICASRESFASIVIDAFSSCHVQIMQWVCAKENHQDEGFHFHMAVKLRERHRWRRIRQLLEERHAIRVNFSNRHDNYYSAWRYTTKEDGEYIQSAGHTDLMNAQPPQTSRATEAWRIRNRGNSRRSVPSGRRRSRKKQLTVYEVSQLVVQKGIKTRLELLALAQEQQLQGKTDLAQFITNRGSKVVDESIRVGWELNEAPTLLVSSRLSRIERLEQAYQGNCVLNCSQRWLSLARNILERNNIGTSEFVGAVRLLLEKGRGKYRNILLTGPSNCGKTFLLNPLNVIYDTFSNPATTSFAWVGVECSDIIFLNDFRWSSQVIPWNNMLLLLEGQMVHFPAPKTHYARDIEFNKDCPVFCTANEQFSLVRGGVVDQVETEMMTVRWRTFALFSQIPAQEQIIVPACGRCFAEFILH